MLVAQSGFVLTHRFCYSVRHESRDRLTPNRIAQFDPAHVAAFLAEPATSNVLE
jgi:hypothetical protein